MKYKVGEKVIVRNDLIVGKTYEDVAFIKEMSKYKLVTIKNSNKNSYLINEDNGWYFQLLQHIKQQSRLSLNALFSRYNKDSTI